MTPDDPCRTCVIRTAAALGWRLELPAGKVPRRCPLAGEDWRTTESAGHEEPEEACSSAR